MTPDQTKKVWGWVGKLGLVAIPALITGYASYKTSATESQVQTSASYETLRVAVEKLRKDSKERGDQLNSLSGQVRTLTDLYAKTSKHSNTKPTNYTPGVKPEPDPNKVEWATVKPSADGDGISDDPGFAHYFGADGGIPTMSKTWSLAWQPKGNLKANLPANFNDMVQNYRAQEKK